MEGSEIDWVDDMIGASFQIKLKYHYPHAAAAQFRHINHETCQLERELIKARLPNVLRFGKSATRRGWFAKSEMR